MIRKRQLHSMWEAKDDSATYYYVQMDGSQRVSRVLIDTVEKALGWKVDSSAE